MRAVGYISSSRVGYEVGENIAWGTLYLATPRAIVAAWMASPGHRANILDARYRETGIGVSPHPPDVALPRAARRHLHAGLRRHHPRLSRFVTLRRARSRSQGRRSRVAIHAGRI